MIIPSIWFFYQNGDLEILILRITIHDLHIIIELDTVIHLQNSPRNWTILPIAPSGLEPIPWPTHGLPLFAVWIISFVCPNLGNHVRSFLQCWNWGPFSRWQHVIPWHSFIWSGKQDKFNYLCQYLSPWCYISGEHESAVFRYEEGCFLHSTEWMVLTGKDN